ncbi:MIR domain containing protein [Trichomonas vaginalis G3]|uniref:MIR domain containing protein n=1 Tax=Trichomonas vaginalis (strain ATCC PRA-98 / G3) TaxID=412133 RepID=A2FMW9_TRIV3|nr:dolichyl-phosphate-mannose-protein mannosyltransferase protein [Trichomonas vaginalis G3]EAX93737.1 MIR domain containing protein [Trichomonas vaginalis G3]KAI5533752.1 dolichyl-phosphate-mannose-protein mannosyltransferase protein [Trichomonas vaginalis G3]|eukprot:XP_001306667.1 MIR domain containing protein [Trichomonas vaginalis G3]
MFLFFCNSISTSEEVLKQIAELPVTYYSIVRLENVQSQLLLSSFEGHYVTGSKQQIARGVNSSKQALAELYFNVLSNNRSSVLQGDYVRCGDELTLQHTVSSGFLHSHNFTSPLNSGHEISIYPLPDEIGNVWKVVCTGDIIKFRQPFKLLNIKMNEYLSVNAKGLYPADIGGHNEMYCSDNQDQADWFVRHGVFVN